jgi:hypothetical protein
MGEIADEMIDRMMGFDPFPNHPVSNRKYQTLPQFIAEERKNNESKKFGLSKGERKPMYNRNSGNYDYEKDVKRIFKMQTAENGQYAVSVEKGVHKEIIAISFDKAKYRAKGFIKTSESLFNQGQNTVKEIINMHEVITSMVNLLNNLFSADLLTEDQYNLVMDAFEPFLYEALDFTEVEPFLEKDSALNKNKKKRITRRGRA